MYRKVRAPAAPLKLFSNLLLFFQERFFFFFFKLQLIVSESAPLLFLEKGLLFMSGNKCSPFSTMSDEGRTFIVEMLCNVPVFKGQSTPCVGIPVYIFLVDYYFSLKTKNQIM